MQYFNRRVMGLFLTIFLIQASLSVYAGRVEELEAEMAKQKDLMEQLKVEKVKAIENEKQRAKVEQNLARLNDRLVAAEQDLAASEKAVNDNKNETAKLKADIDKAQKAQGPIRDALADMIDERSQIKKMIDEKQKQFDDLEAKINAQKQKLAQFNDLREAAEKRNIVLDSESGKNKQKVKDSETNVAGIEKEIATERLKLKEVS